MILNRLRLETRAQHDMLDQHPLLVQLMHPTLSLDDYRRILKKFWGFYQSIEPVLARHTFWPAFGITLDERRKLPWLQADLSRLQIPLAGLRQSPHPEWIRDDATALGTFYVVEGSTLGGRVIARHVGARLGLTPDQGLAYFSSYGEEVGARWRETRHALVQFAEQFKAEEEMIAAAQRTFQALADWLDATHSPVYEPDFPGA